MTATDLPMESALPTSLVLASLHTEVKKQAATPPPPRMEWGGGRGDSKAVLHTSSSHNLGVDTPLPKSRRVRIT